VGAMSGVAGLCAVWSGRRRMTWDHFGEGLRVAVPVARFLARGLLVGAVDGWWVTWRARLHRS
jgi:ABC-type xylose transport system permease subunit